VQQGLCSELFGNQEKRWEHREQPPPAAREWIPSGKPTKNYGKIHHAINGKKLTISMAMFNSKPLT